MKGIAFMIACATCVVAAVPGDALATESSGLERWKFLIGEWDLVETRFDFDGKRIETNPGHATFSPAMNGQRIQELQTVTHGNDTTTALHVFVYDPGTKEVEVARTDSGHYGFWVIIGTMADGRMDLREKHPDPESEITRRITYLHRDDDHVTRRLEFSQDRGESWFVRSEWAYTRE